MKQKTLLKTKKELVFLARQERQFKLKQLFKKHIGQRKAISQITIFKFVYGNYYNYNELQVFYLWHKLKQDMNWLRKSSNYFIGMMNMKGLWVYFIIKNYDDAKHYIEILKNTQKKCEYMINKCMEAVRRKQYKELD